MKSKHVLLLGLSLALIGTVSACQQPSSSNTSNSSSESSSLDEYNFDFKGITIDNTYVSTDCSFSGIINDVLLGNWMVAEETYYFNIEFKTIVEQTFRVDIEDESILTYEKIDAEGQIMHTLVGHKTGGTVVKIYDSEDTLVYRAAINCRVAVRDPYIMMEQIAKADYWYGLLASTIGYGQYRMVFDLNEETGYSNLCTLSAIDSGVDYGQSIFTIDLESGEEFSEDTFRTLDFTCTMVNNPEIKPVKFAVSLALDTIYVSESFGVLDMFRPAYLE